MTDLIAGILSSEDIYSSPEKTKKLFRFAANNQLSAGLFPCGGLDCRMNEAYNLSIFSVLYADQVIIYFPFEKYEYEENWDWEARENLYNDFIIYDFIKPLISKGYIIFGKGVGEMCPKCTKKALKPFSDEIKQIENRVLRNTSIILNTDCSTFDITTDEDVFGHKKSSLIYKEESLNKYFKNITNGHRLSIAEIKKSKILSNQIIDNFLDIVAQNKNANYYDANYLTSNEFSINMISLLNLKSKHNNNNLKYNDLTHGLPYIFGTNILNLIELREKEFEAFVLYRDSIKKAINDANDNNERMNEIFDDLIRPNV